MLTLRLVNSAILAWHLSNLNYFPPLFCFLSSASSLSCPITACMEYLCCQNYIVFLCAHKTILSLRTTTVSAMMLGYTEDKNSPFTAHSKNMHLPFTSHTTCIHLPFTAHSKDMHLPFTAHTTCIHLPFTAHTTYIHLPNTAHTGHTFTFHITHNVLYTFIFHSTFSGHTYIYTFHITHSGHTFTFHSKHEAGRAKTCLARVG